MSSIICPECRKKISSSASFCPHCGYPVSEKKREPIIETFPAPTGKTKKTGDIFHNGYDVILVDYEKTAIATANRIKEVIGCSYVEASSVLSSLPAYLYIGLSYSDAVYIAQSLQYHRMRVGVIDPWGNTTYYAPSGYSKLLPEITGITRKARFKVLPQRQYQFVVRRQKIDTPKGILSMPKPESEVLRKEQLYFKEPKTDKAETRTQKNKNSLNKK